MSGGGSSAPAQPATTTQIQDIPSWEQGYVTDLLGQAQTLAAQPYQQFPGQQVAGFTPDQTQAFSNIEGSGATNQANQANALNYANAGANTVGNIYNAGAGDVNAASGYNPLAAVSPYLGAAAGYNSAAAAQPGINQSSMYNMAAAQQATPQGIQNYMSPYTNDVVQGLENTANQNWNQNIMPGVNNEFVGSGQYGSGRNAQVIGQAANQFQTNLNTGVANALQSGYTTAGNQAATEAGILGNSANTALSGANTASNAQTAQTTNLLNQANAAGTATQQQASNLVNQGNALGNLTATQGQQQVAAGTALGNLGAQDASTNLTQNQALQATGQQQQQLNQTNLNTAMQNYQNQVQYPEQQTEYLNQIIRGLPAPSASTSSTQTTPAYSVSPLSAVGGAGTAALSLNGNSVGSLTAAHGGLIKGYAAGGTVTTGDDNEDNYDPEDINNPLTMMSNPESDSDFSVDAQDGNNPINSVPQQVVPQQTVNPIAPNEPVETQSASKANNKVPDGQQFNGFTKADMQQDQLLALARGMLTPSLQGSTAAAFGQGIGNAQDIGLKEREINMQQNALAYQRKQDAKKLALEQSKGESDIALNNAKAKMYSNGGPQGNRIIGAINPNTNEIEYVTAEEAKQNGYKPIAGFNMMNTTLKPEAIDQMTDALASGATMQSLGLGYGQSANKTAVLNAFQAKYPNVNLADAQVQMVGNKAGARTVGTAGGRIELASQSLGSMIPLAKEAASKLDSTQYPDVNAIENAVSKHTGGTGIVTLNTYLQAVIADHAALIARSGVPTDTARATAKDMANAAMSKGQLNSYFDAVNNEIGAQKSAVSVAMKSFGTGKSTGQSSQANPAPSSVSSNSDRIAALLAARAKLGTQ